MHLCSCTVHTAEAEARTLCETRNHPGCKRRDEASRYSCQRIFNTSCGNNQQFRNMTGAVPAEEGVLPDGTTSPSEASSKTNGTYANALHNISRPKDQDPRLCGSCQVLDISVDKFVIQDYDASRSQTRSQFAAKSKNAKYSLGSFSDISAKSSTCSLCYLVAQSIKGGRQLADADVECFATWEIDGRGSSGGGPVRPRTRRIHLRWSKDGPEDSYLVFMAPENHVRFNSDAKNVWDKDSLYLGRTVSSNGENAVLMKSWLDGCCRGHTGQCVNELDRDFEDMIRQSYFGVIDVLDMRLTALPYETLEERKTNPQDRDSDDWRPRGRQSYYNSNDSDATEDGAKGSKRERTLRAADFVALSYVWGPPIPKAPYITTLENILIHRNPDGLARCLDLLPQAVRDAIDLVRRLGFRYLWVDALCIVQNSERSWKLNASVMDLIYSNAILTICAADGANSKTGLEAYKATSIAKDQHPTSSAKYQNTAVCAPGVRLMVSHLAETSIRNSAWNSRAWTFQERLLSRRCLIFAEGRVFFQCRATTMSEDIVAEPEGAGWSLDLVQAPPRMLRELDTRSFWVYTNCVYLYSSRALTKQKDILAAFNGVSNRISKVMKAPFIFGLPSSHFDLALLWQPRSALERRRTESQKTNQQDEQYEFPSWSWCGWTASNSHHTGGVEYGNDMVDGCLTNVREWLMTHTWIRWHIRDGHGNLRALWDGTKIADDSPFSPWKGYLSIKDKERLFDDRDIEDPGALDVRLLGYDLAGIGEKNKGPRDLLHYANHGMPEPEIIDITHHRRRYQGHGHMNIKGREHIESTDRHDEYGRFKSQAMLCNTYSKFQQTFPENPYRVVLADYTAEIDKEFPDQPLLQFWTWSAALRLLPATQGGEKLGDGLQRYDIADDVGDWCGSIVLDVAWAAEHLSKKPKHEFIAISDARGFSHEECDVWTYYIPKERDQSEWDLYYVLLVDNRNSMVKQRVALGKVFRAAFENTTPCQAWKEIVLG